MIVNQRYRFDPLEPANSYEVSYALMIGKGLKLGLTIADLNRIIGKDRIGEIQQWTSYGLTRRWLTDHTSQVFGIMTTSNVAQGNQRT